MELAVRRCIKLIRMHDTEQSIKEKLVSKLCELRIKLNELNENENENIHFGHGLYTVDDSKQLVCDICDKKQKSNSFISLLKSPIKDNELVACATCNYCVHQDCLKQVRVFGISFYFHHFAIIFIYFYFCQNTLRYCPKEFYDKQLKENNYKQSYEFVVLRICPEIGLSKQQFKCNDCKNQINLSNSNLCDYDGKYYCIKCHNGALTVIPARIIHNWDFEPRPVSKRSLLIVNFIKNKPILFDILQLNSMLYGLVEELSVIKV